MFAFANARCPSIVSIAAEHPSCAYTGSQSPSWRADVGAWLRSPSVTGEGDSLATVRCDYAMGSKSVLRCRPTRADVGGLISRGALPMLSRSACFSGTDALLKRARHPKGQTTPVGDCRWLAKRAVCAYPALAENTDGSAKWRDDTRRGQCCAVCFFRAAIFYRLGCHG